MVHCITLLTTLVAVCRIWDALHCLFYWIFFGGGSQIVPSGFASGTDCRLVNKVLNKNNNKYGICQGKQASLKTSVYKIIR